MGIESIAGAAISGVGGLIGSSIQGSAAKDAANTQANAAKYAADQQLAAAQLSVDNTRQMYDQNVLRAAPFVTAGSGAVGNLAGAAGGLGAPLTANVPNDVSGVPNEVAGVSNLISGLNLSSPIAANPAFAPTVENLARTPGYQFTLDQGLKATQNSYAGQGLATSGAAMKGAAKYAEDLASTTYQNQFSNWMNQQKLGLENYTIQSGNLLNQANIGQTFDLNRASIGQTFDLNKANIGQNFNLGQNSQIYNMLSGLSTLGANAAAGLGTQGIQASGQINNALIGGTTAANQFLTSGAAAQSAGIVGAANANAGMFSNLGNLALLYGMNPGNSGGLSSLFNFSGNGDYGGGSSPLVPGFTGGGPG